MPRAPIDVVIDDATPVAVARRIDGWWRSPIGYRVRREGASVSVSRRTSGGAFALRTGVTARLALTAAGDGTRLAGDLRTGVGGWLLLGVFAAATVAVVAAAVLAGQPVALLLAAPLCGMAVLLWVVERRTVRREADEIAAELRQALASGAARR